MAQEFSEILKSDSNELDVNEKSMVDYAKVIPSGKQISIDTDSCWRHDLCPPITAPCNPTYCSVCGLPPDFCEFGDRWDECRPYVLKQFPQYYPHLLPEASKHGNDGALYSAASYAVSCTATEEFALPTDFGTSVDSIQKTSKKKNKETISQVTIQRVTRAKRAITVVIGLDAFGVKMDKAAKLFAKHFSSGASFVKASIGLPAQIDVQGDVEGVIGGVITDNFPEVTSDKIKYLKPK